MRALALLRFVSLLASAGPAFAAEGIATRYPRDTDIARDPAVLFADGFESGDFTKWDERRGTAAVSADHAHSGRWCAAMPMAPGGITVATPSNGSAPARTASTHAST